MFEEEVADECDIETLVVSGYDDAVEMGLARIHRVRHSEARSMIFNSCAVFVVGKNWRQAKWKTIEDWGF